MDNAIFDLEAAGDAPGEFTEVVLRALEDGAG